MWESGSHSASRGMKVVSVSSSSSSTSTCSSSFFVCAPPLTLTVVLAPPSSSFSRSSASLSLSSSSRTSSVKSQPSASGGRDRRCCLMASSSRVASRHEARRPRTHTKLKNEIVFPQSLRASGAASRGRPLRQALSVKTSLISSAVLQCVRPSEENGAWAREKKCARGNGTLTWISFRHDPRHSAPNIGNRCGHVTPLMAAAAVRFMALCAAVVDKIGK